MGVGNSSQSAVGTWDNNVPNAEQGPQLLARPVASRFENRSGSPLVWAEVRDPLAATSADALAELIDEATVAALTAASEKPPPRSLWPTY